MRGGPGIMAMLFAVGSVASCFQRLCRVHRALSFDLHALARTLGRSADRARLAEMRARMLDEGESWDEQVIDAALEARDEIERTALVNEHLAEIALRLDGGRRVPVVAARVSVVGPLAVLFFALARGHTELADIVPVLAWGGMGLMVSVAAGRQAEAVAARSRQAVDVWVDRVLDASRRGGG